MLPLRAALRAGTRFPHHPGRPVDPRTLQLRFGRAVRRRLAARLGQEDLADRANLHRTHVSLLERGGRMPTLHVVQKLAAALGTTMRDLLGEVESDEELDEPPPIPKGRPPGTGRNAGGAAGGAARVGPGAKPAGSGSAARRRPAGR